MGHDHAGDAALARGAHEAHHASPFTESSAPVGSSARSRRRSPTTARAIATRWRSPPDSSSGKRSARSATPSSSRAASAATSSRLRASAVELQRQRHVLGGGQTGQQVEVLEHVADRPATQPRSVVPRHRRGVLPVDAAPCPRSPPRACPAIVSIVLLPEPLGPMIATSSPGSTVRSTPSQGEHRRRALAVRLGHLRDLERHGLIAVLRLAPRRRGAGRGNTFVASPASA